MYEVCEEHDGAVIVLFADKKHGWPSKWQGCPLCFSKNRIEELEAELESAKVECEELHEEIKLAEEA